MFPPILASRTVGEKAEVSALDGQGRKVPGQLQRKKKRPLLFQSSSAMRVRAALRQGCPLPPLCPYIEMAQNLTLENAWRQKVVTR